MPSLNDIYQMLDPVAFTIGPLSVRWYGLAYLAGFALGAVVMWQLMKRWRLDVGFDELLSIVVGIAFGGILGGRLGYVLFYGAGYYWENPLAIFMLNQGGMSIHGGLLGAFIGGSIVCRSLKVSILTICDLGFTVTPIGLFFGRLANFVNGELWGKVTDLPWGVVFETGGPLPRHPSQLYEALLEGLVLFLVLYFLARRRPPYPQGFYTGLFLVLYGVFRILVEFVRVPDAQLGYLFGPITMGQVLSLPLILLGVGLLVWSFSTQRPQIGHYEVPVNRA